MKTEFVPKLVATATTCCALYLILKVSANLLTVKTLASVGYFDTLVRLFAPPFVKFQVSKFSTHILCQGSHILVDLSEHTLQPRFSRCYQVAPVETSYRLARTRIKTNAYRINKFEYPFYEDLVNVRTKRYQLMLEMYRYQKNF